MDLIASSPVPVGESVLVVVVEVVLEVDCVGLVEVEGVLEGDCVGLVEVEVLIEWKLEVDVQEDVVSGCADVSDVAGESVVGISITPRNATPFCLQINCEAQARVRQGSARDGP